MKRFTQGFWQVRSVLIAAAVWLFSGLAATASAQCPIIVTQQPTLLNCKMPTTEICIMEVASQTVSWSTIDGLIDGATDGTCVTAAAPGTYTVTVTSAALQCSNTMDFVVSDENCLPTCEIIEPEDGAILECDSSGNIATVVADADPCGVWEIVWRFVQPVAPGWYIEDGVNDPTMMYHVGGHGTTAVLQVEVIAMSGCKTFCEVTLHAECPPPPPQCPVIITQVPNQLNCKMPTTEICVEEVPGATISWSTLDGNIQGATDGACITATAAGTYTVTVSNPAEDCTTSVDIEVTDEDCLPTCEIIIPEDGAILECDSSGNIATVIAEADPCGVWEIVWRFVQPVPPEWYIEDGVNDPTMTFHVGGHGTTAVLQVEVIAMSGCKTFCEVTLHADCPPPPPQCPVIITQEPGLLNCKMPTTQICVQEIAGATISWSTLDGNIQGPANTACITATAPGTYTVTVSNPAEDCTTSVDIEVEEEDCPPTCIIVQPEDGAVLECNSSGNIAIVVAEAEPCGVWEIVWRFVQPVPPEWYIEFGVNNPVMSYHVGGHGTTAVLQVEVVSMSGCKTFCEVTLHAECPPPPPQCPVVTVDEPDILRCPDSTAEICAESSVADVSYAWSTDDGVIQGETDEACITAAKAGTYNVTVTNNDTGCSTTVAVDVFSDLDVPICDIIPPDSSPAANSTGNTLSAVTTDADGYLWEVDNNDFVITDGQGTDTITFTAGPAGSSAKFTLTVSSESGCEGVCEITISIPSEPGEGAFCSFTQGFWGNKNGLAIMTDLLAEQTLVVGLPGRSITVSGADEAACLNKFLPAGGTPGPLSEDLGDASFGADCNLSSGPGLRGQAKGLAKQPERRGEGKNVLLGQTIALSLNVMVSEGLCDLELCDVMVTRKAITDGDEVIVDPDDTETVSRSISQAVQDALANLGLPNTVCGLLELANRALGGDPNLGGASYSQISDAAAAINEVFDECRILVECRDATN